MFINTVRFGVLVVVEVLCIVCIGMLCMMV